MDMMVWGMPVTTAIIVLGVPVLILIALIYWGFTYAEHGNQENNTKE